MGSPLQPKKGMKMNSTVNLSTLVDLLEKGRRQQAGFKVKS